MKKLTLTSLLLLGSATLAAAQAINSCNLLPNPSFEQQNVTQPSGNPNNIAGMYSQYNEVASWQCFGNYYGPDSPTYGRPTYYATNAPVGSATNPFTNPATNVNGSPFQPYNYNPSTNNGALSIIAAEVGYSSPINQPQYITATVLQALTPSAAYYASFQAYRSSAPGGAVRLGMQLSQDGPQLYTTGSTMQSAAPVTNSAWTRVSGKISIPNPLPNGHSSSDPWTVTIGNISPNGPGSRARYYIDEVELYKIPTAGPAPAIVCSNPNTSFTLGEGRPIPGATYTWSAPGVNGLPTNSSTIQTIVSPTTTTTYTLTVNLPDGSTHATTVTVSVFNPTDPTGAEFYTGRYEGCRRYYNVLMPAIPTATRYIVNVGVGGPTAQGGAEGFVNSSGYVVFPVDIEGAYRTITAQITVFFGPCGTRTFTFSQTLDGPDPYCNTGPAQSDIVATPYPNPATESVTLPEGVQQATLLDSRGKPVQKADDYGKLNVQSLPDGLYNLQMMQNGKLINQRIQVKH